MERIIVSAVGAIASLYVMYKSGYIQGVGEQKIRELKREEKGGK